MIRKVLAGICAFSLMYSCSKDDVLSTGVQDTDSNGEPVAAVFAPRFVKQKWVSSGSADTDGPDTRVWNQTWTDGDRIGVYMLRKSGATYDFDLSKAMHKNKLYTVDADAGAFDEANSSVMYYPLNGDPVKFVAYYPYDQNATTNNNTLTFDFTEQDATDGSEKEAKDFIFHIDEEEVEYPKDDDHDNVNDLVALALNHKFSKILITIINESGEEFTADNLQVRLTGMPETATVDLTKLAKGEAGELALTGTTDIKPHIRPIEFDHAYIEAIVPPHVASAYTTREFKFNVGTKEYKHPVTNDFVSGNSYAYVLTLAQGHIANCYIVNPGTAENPTTSEAIPIVRASKYGGMLAGAEVHLEVLWDDNGVINTTDAPPTLNGSSFTVTTTGNHGNAGIALRDNTTNDIYWSWHIWVTDYDPSIPENTWTNPNSPTYTFMDRNLGATAAELSPAGVGLTYQWGRKDPFPGVAPGTAGRTGAEGYILYNIMTQFGTANASTAIENAIHNPTAWMPGIGTHANWAPIGSTNLWGGNDNTKTIYDPCPDGWRVPILKADTPFPWEGLNHVNWAENANGGINWGTNVVYPVTGYWKSNFTPFQGLYNHFAVWTGTTNHDGTFDGARAFMEFRQYRYQYQMNRSLGAAVRCVQE